MTTAYASLFGSIVALMLVANSGRATEMPDIDSRPARPITDPVNDVPHTTGNILH